MNLVVKTVYFDDLILSHFRNKKYTPLPNTTLNEKFNINKNIISEIDKPTLNYYCIGNGNVRVIDSEVNMELYHNNHRCIDGSLYNHIPFIIRLLDEDITDVQKRNYRLRKTFTIHGKDYVAYYLKVIPEDKISNQLLKITKIPNMMPKTEKFNTNDSTILNPNPNLPDVVKITDDVSTFIVNSDQVTLSLTNEEMLEVNNAMDILEIPIKDRIINEIALCSGTDVVNTKDFSIEVAHSQVMFFVDVDYDVQLILANEDEFYRQVEIGGMQASMLT